MARPLHYAQNEQGSSFNITGHSAPASLIPGSPDSFSIDGLSRTTEMDAYGNYAPLGPLGHTSHTSQGSFNDYRPLGSNGHGHHALLQDSGRGLPLNQYLSDRDAAPWNPLKAHAGPRPGALKPSQPAGLQQYDFYPATADPSECADSGYFGSMSGSMARQSVVDSSVYGDPDRGMDTQSFVQPFSELQLQHTRGPDSTSVTGKRPRDAWHPHLHSTNLDSARMTCPTCKAPVKTKAELNKHKARHDKPFVCKVPGCTRKQGFGTSNDLARHDQSVHGASGIKYRCQEGQCKAKQKNWPRADNFKQHLKRVHQIQLGAEEDLSAYEYKPSRAEDLACLGSSEAQVDMPAHPDHISPSYWIGLDQSQNEQPGLPSGEIGYGSLYHRRLSEFQASMMDVDEARIENQHSLDDGRLHLEMENALSEVGNHRNHVQNASATILDGLYQAGHEGEPDLLGIPAGLTSPADQRRTVSHAPKAVPMEADDPSEPSKGENPEESDADEPCTLEQPEQTTPEESGQDPADGNGTREASEGPSPIEDHGQDDAVETFHDTQELFNTPGSTPDGQAKTHKSPGAADEPAPTELPSVRDLLGNAGLGEAMGMDETEASALVQSLMAKGLLDRIIAKLGYQKAEEEEEKAKQNPQGPVPQSGGKNKCSECEKSFHRPCELKKHMKRHDKPYACTHADCEKRFGSKNDWKRHENSQHIQLEFWRCSEKSKDRQAACPKICHRRETFRHHLERDHSLSDPKIIEKRCTDCRIGRNFESRFWCGFCQQTIDFEKNGGLAWSERFDHIDAHFTGKGGPKKDIKDWKSIESAPLETFETIIPRARSLTSRSSGGLTPSSSSSDGETSYRVEVEVRPPKRDRIDDDDDEQTAPPNAKRTRIIRGHKIDHQRETLLWVCCGCKQYWSHSTTTRCLESGGCAHEFCTNCGLVLQEKIEE